MTEIAVEPSPGELYVKALWARRWLFLLIVGIFVGGALGVTQLLPQSFPSQAILGVRTAPRLDPNVIPYSRPDELYPSAIMSSVNTSTAEDEVGAARFVRRLTANSLVTAAAREAGALRPDERLDEQKLRTWLTVDAHSDLVFVTVMQPTAEGANRFATALVTRAMAANQADVAADPATRKTLEQELRRTMSSMLQAEAAVAQASSLSGVKRENATDRGKLELSLAREQYAAIRRRLGMLDITGGNQRFQLYIIDPPNVPIRPTFPRPLLNVSIGLILGILTALVFISLRSMVQEA